MSRVRAVWRRATLTGQPVPAVTDVPLRRGLLERLVSVRSPDPGGGRRPAPVQVGGARCHLTSLSPARLCAGVTRGRQSGGTSERNQREDRSGCATERCPGRRSAGDSRRTSPVSVDEQSGA